MKKVLFISYFFPPVGGGGAVRITKFAKYLEKFAWQPIVLTPQKTFYPIQDPSLLKELSKNVKIERIGYFEMAFFSNNRYWQSFLAYFLYPLVLTPDRQILWLLPAFRRARKLIQKEKINIIFTSSPSYTDHLIALLLKKTLKIKWVADFRDEWSNNASMRFPTVLHRKIARFLEKKVIENADQIIGVSGPLTSYLGSLSKNKRKFLTITNGYDPDDFKNNFTKKRSKNFQIVHSGALYGERKSDSFMEVIRELNIKEIEPVFIGQDKRVSHSFAISQLKNADILLLLLATNDSPSIMTGKIFEYLAARRPILALAPKNTAAAKLIKRLNVGTVVDSQDKKALKKVILNFYQKWRKNKLNIAKVNIEPYNRLNLTKKLAETFDKLVFKREKIKLCLVGDLNSIHNIRWANFYKNKFDVHFISPNFKKINNISTHCLIPKRGLLKWPPLYFLYSSYQTRHFLKQIKPDIIHGQNLIVGGIRVYLSGCRPYIVTAWGSDVFLLDKMVKIEQKLIINLLKKASIITYDSQILGQEIKRISQKVQGLHEVQFGVDASKFKFNTPDLRYKKSLGLKSNDKIIFHPRGLTQLYNTDILIKAFAEILPRNPGIKLLLLAFNTDNDFVKRLRLLIKELNIQDKVIFINKVSHEEMVKLYNLSEIIVSIPSSDSSPVSVLEAMACGKKIVLSDLAYVKEWLSPQKDNFFLVKDSNIKTLAKTLDTALNKKSYNHIKNFNRKIILEKADSQKNIALMEKLYHEII